MLTNADKPTFTGKKLKAALMLAAAEKTQVKICECIGINETTLSRWKRDPDYIAYVDKLTLENELATRAGLLREMYYGAKVKAKHIDGDKSTHLDYMKGIAKVQGLESQKVEISGEVSIKKIEIATSKREDAD